MEPKLTQIRTLSADEFRAPPRAGIPPGEHFGPELHPLRLGMPRMPARTSQVRVGVDEGSMRGRCGLVDPVPAPTPDPAPTST